MQRENLADDQQKLYLLTVFSKYIVYTCKGKNIGDWLDKVMT